VDDFRDRIHSVNAPHRWSGPAQAALRIFKACDFRTAFRAIPARKQAAGVHFREISYTDSEKDAHIAFVRTMLHPIFRGLTMLD
jgi:hypothetical protein